ncbi:MAG TPA: DUF1194 domain-containing protein [Aliidongia sp.]|nr:DUF1194 domain-containing protein [Aliidongia sp.]
MRVGGWTAIVLIGLCGPIAARAAETVDAALVLEVDVSLSVDDKRYELQKEGIAAAFENPDLAKAIATGTEGAVAVEIIEFSDPDRQIPVIGWTRIATAEDAQALAKRIRSVHRTSRGLTGLADALIAAEEAFADLPYASPRRVVDVSGDGMSNIGTEITVARDRLVEAGITINGLPILSEEPWLETYYTEYVVGGPGAFVIPAESLDSFADAMKRKVLQELVVSALPAKDRRG